MKLREKKKRKKKKAERKELNKEILAGPIAKLRIFSRQHLFYSRFKKVVTVKKAGTASQISADE
jgi:hypothetical protein